MTSSASTRTTADRLAPGRAATETSSVWPSADSFTGSASVGRGGVALAFDGGAFNAAGVVPADFLVGLPIRARNLARTGTATALRNSVAVSPSLVLGGGANAFQSRTFCHVQLNEVCFVVACCCGRRWGREGARMHTGLCEAHKFAQKYDVSSWRWAVLL